MPPPRYHAHLLRYAAPFPAPARQPASGAAVWVHRRTNAAQPVTSRACRRSKCAVFPPCFSRAQYRNANVLVGKMEMTIRSRRAGPQQKKTRRSDVFAACARARLQRLFAGPHCVRARVAKAFECRKESFVAGNICAIASATPSAPRRHAPRRHARRRHAVTMPRLSPHAFSCRSAQNAMRRIFFSRTRVARARRKDAFHYYFTPPCRRAAAAARTQKLRARPPALPARKVKNRSDDDDYVFAKSAVLPFIRDITAR